jgi:DNA-directed RNA polymerase subunit RPC12/RpoP
MNEFIVPDIVLVGYGRQQTYQIKCLRCGTQFFSGKEIELFCEDCNDKLTQKQRQKYIGPERYSPVQCVGNVAGWENRVAAIDKRTRYNYNKVYKRDGYICQYCGYNPRTSPDFIALCIDHIIPYSFGGSYRMENLVVACAQCNTIASNKVFCSFEEKKKYILQRRLEKKYFVSDYLISAYELNVKEDGFDYLIGEEEVI